MIVEFFSLAYLLAITYLNLAFIEYEEFCISRMVLSIEAKGRGGYYTLPDLKNSSCPIKATFNNCFIIHLKYFPVLKGVSPFCS